MFLTEKDLRDAFWKNYNYSKRALKYQFECSVNHLLQSHDAPHLPA